MPNQGMPVGRGNKIGIGRSNHKYSQFDTNKLSNFRETNTENTHGTDHLDVPAVI